MISATLAETADTIKQKLPTEIIGIICGFSDFKTHTRIRSTCLSVRLYVPLPKVVGFVEYKKLVELNRNKMWNREEAEKRRVFQERIHLDLHHEELTQDQVQYLNQYGQIYELCRIARNVLDYPEAYKRIDLLVGDCYILAAAIRVDDLKLLIRLIQLPVMDPAACGNRAIRFAASYGRLEIVQFLLKDPRVDPSSSYNYVIRCASSKGHFAVVQ